MKLLLLSHGAYLEAHASHASRGRGQGPVGADGRPKRWQKAAVVQSLECPGNAGRRASWLQRDQPRFCYRASLPATSTLDDYLYHHPRQNGTPYDECARQLRRAAGLVCTVKTNKTAANSKQRPLLISSKTTNLPRQMPPTSSRA
jgi:hypothetical protein